MNGIALDNDAIVMKLVTTLANTNQQMFSKIGIKADILHGIITVLVRYPGF